jgi:hypothetical protein
MRRSPDNPSCRFIVSRMTGLTMPLGVKLKAHHVPSPVTNPVTNTAVATINDTHVLCFRETLDPHPAGGREPSA